MDTREKIVQPAELVQRLEAGKGWIAAVGTFDPVTLAQAERLAKLAENGRRVLAVVENGRNGLLPVEARAILLAALKSVRLVVVTEAASLKAFPQLEIVKDDEGERERTADFVQHVKQRQGLQ